MVFSGVADQSGAGATLLWVWGVVQVVEEALLAGRREELFFHPWQRNFSIALSDGFMGMVGP